MAHAPLKRRKRGIVRQVPLPRDTLRDLNRFFKLRLMQSDPQLTVERLWKWSRTTAWRRVKVVMAAAGIKVSMFATPLSMSIAAGVSASTSEIRPPLQLNTRQNSRVSGSAEFAALRKHRRSAALRYFRAPVGPYRLIPASACGRIDASRETEWPILFQASSWFRAAAAWRRRPKWPSHSTLSASCALRCCRRNAGRFQMRGGGTALRNTTSCVDQAKRDVIVFIDRVTVSDH
jgi:hypothetical protein